MKHNMENIIIKLPGTINCFGELATGLNSDTNLESDSPDFQLLIVFGKQVGRIGCARGKAVLLVGFAASTHRIYSIGFGGAVGADGPGCRLDFNWRYLPETGIEERMPGSASQLIVRRFSQGLNKVGAKWKCSYSSPIRPGCSHVSGTIDGGGFGWFPKISDLGYLNYTVSVPPWSQVSYL